MNHTVITISAKNNFNFLFLTISCSPIARYHMNICGRKRVGCSLMEQMIGLRFKERGKGRTPPGGEACLVMNYPWLRGCGMS